MDRRLPTRLALASLCGLACHAPALENWSAGDPTAEPTSTTTTTTGSTTLAPEPTTTAPTSTTTTDALDTTTATTTTATDTTTAPESTGTGEAALPPAIVDHDLDPDPLLLPAPIAVTIATEHADGVRMQLDGRPSIDLHPVYPDLYGTELSFYSALDNGPHVATFVAWRDGRESAPRVVPFAVDLPKPGSEMYWDSDMSLGPGTVAGLAVTPAHELIEFGTHFSMNQSRCYLRRRALDGDWVAIDIVAIHPDTPCSAVDLAADSSGALYLLSTRFLGGLHRWTLARIDAWGQPPVELGSGAASETAHALALDSAHVAVCGTKTKQAELDAAVWIFEGDQLTKALTFDYPDEKDTRHFSEQTRDCVFAGNTLVLAGEAHGPHDKNLNDLRNRHFLLEVEPDADSGDWHVAPPGPRTQSRARAIALHHDGRYLTIGDSCDDLCIPEAELRMFLPGGIQTWHQTLDAEVQSPRAIAWSPANYLVYVASRDKGKNTTAFFAEAWVPLQLAPLWSYAHLDAPEIHSATTVVIGPYGQIYAGGATAGGYPAVAIIAP